jgi:hypothetical protein
MLKWLLAGAPSRQTKPAISTEVVTDDPLALICTHKVDRPLEIYAVSRSVVGLSDNCNELLYLMAASLFILPKHESKLSRLRVVALRVVTV